MNTTRSLRGRASERGEGWLRVIIFLTLIVTLGYLAIQNLPTYFAIQNLKHDLAELTRGMGAFNMPVERVQPQAYKIATQYDISPNDVKVEKEGNTIKITLNTTKQLNLIVTNYDWHVSEVYRQQSW